MFQKLMTSALIAGGVAGLFAALLHFAFVQEYILLGEQFETGEIVHFQNAPEVTGGHDHATPEGATADTAHDHAPAAHDEENALTRNLLTVAFTVLIYIGYGMLLTAGFAVAAQFGIAIGAAQGALWGLAGYAAFQLAPAMGLPPELPGTVAADLSARQVWWWGTVCASGVGIALLAYGRNWIMMAVGVALLAAPHVIGAPHLDGFFSPAPAEVGGTFAARVLGVGLAAWVALGWVAGGLWSRTVAE